MTTVRYGAAGRPRSSGTAVCTMPPPPSTALARGFEVDPHDDPPWGWVAHLREPGTRGTLCALSGRSPPTRRPQAQVRADAERAIARYQVADAKFTAAPARNTI